MNIERLTENRLDEFISYCRKYGKEHDETNVSGEDLAEFIPNDENPSYILTDENNNMIGVVSLIIDTYMKRGRRGRFRILHSTNTCPESYKLMVNAILPHTNDIDRVFLFLPDQRNDVGSILISLGFNIERYTFVMVRDDIDIKEPIFPEGYRLVPFQFGRDEEAWCEVRNEGFSRLAGSDIPMTADMVSKMQQWEDYIEGGMMILYNGNEPVGVIRGSSEEYNSNIQLAIGPLAVKPKFQHMGLGRNLLRTALKFGRLNGILKSHLCVNAENENALSLYLNEGFNKDEVVICYNMNV